MAPRTFDDLEGDTEFDMDTFVGDYERNEDYENEMNDNGEDLEE